MARGMLTACRCPVCSVAANVPAVPNQKLDVDKEMAREAGGMWFRPFLVLRSPLEAIRISERPTGNAFGNPNVRGSGQR